MYSSVSAHALFTQATHAYKHTYTQITTQNSGGVHDTAPVAPIKLASATQKASQKKAWFHKKMAAALLNYKAIRDNGGLGDVKTHPAYTVARQFAPGHEVVLRWENGWLFDRVFLYGCLWMGRWILYGLVVRVRAWCGVSDLWLYKIRFVMC